MQSSPRRRVVLGDEEGLQVKNPVIIGVVNPYVQYTVCSRRHRIVKEVPRRYSDFEWLFHRLEDEYGNVRPEFLQY